MKRRVTRYNDRIGPELSSGMMVLTIFFAAVIILCVYFACNVDVPQKKPDGETFGTYAADTNDTESKNTDTDTPSAPNDDKTDIITVSDSEMRRGYLILVNGTYKYEFGGEDIAMLYHNEEKSSSYGLADASVSCEHSIMPMLNAFIDAYCAAANDDDVVVNSGHRTYAEQDEILQDRIKTDGEEEAYKYVMTPGYSEHHTGFSLDIASHGANYDRNWMPSNCHRFGFVQRYRSDKESITGIAYEYWHYRYVGAPHAEIMMSSNLCLEEYIELIHGYSYESPLAFTDENGADYLLYYTPCQNNGETEIKVPHGSDYTVSGDNVSGFIVTVKVSDGEDGGMER